MGKFNQESASKLFNHLDDIKQIMGEGVQLTLVVRFSEEDEEGMIIGTDKDITKARKVLGRDMIYSAGLDTH
jgi:hypothetical protein